MSRINYTREFRLTVSREAIKPEYRGLEHVLAEKYGIRPRTVAKWRAIYLENGEDSFKKGFSRSSNKTDREKQLERENEELRQEIEILKKAAAFLANVKRE